MSARPPLSPLSPLRVLPNLISLGRVLLSGLLLWLVLSHDSHAFLWLVILAWSSDLADGWLARRFGWVSRLGAVLDSAADILLILVTLFAVSRFYPLVFRDHAPILWAVVGVWTVVHVVALVRYGRTASFHTRLARIGIALFALFVAVLFSYGFVGWLYYLCGATCLVAGVENLLMLWLLDEWTPDAHASLISALRATHELE